MSVRGGVRRTFPYVVAAIGGMLAAYLVAAFVIFPSGLLPDEVKVPPVVGLLYEAAEQRLAQAGLKAERTEERPHPNAPKGTILEQFPAAGAKENAGTTITLTVSAGQQTSEVPRVVGRSQQEAEQELEARGFDVGTVQELASPRPRGEVIDTRPPGGTRASTPSLVSLVVSAGTQQITVPDFTGQSLIEARQMAEQLGLRLGDVITEPGMRGSMVHRQNPPAGARVNPGTRIDIRLTGEPYDIPPP